ncbi:hypothetical protein [Rhodovulum sp. ES.010]|uniref:hypothetical protein n=1 Tax=Rhodovulum sp. ES.010 TaxID=1882821 RepID=UPI0009408B6C|nr:hypothetical protein [Rhodovulum sp. ES.010]
MEGKTIWIGGAVVVAAFALLVMQQRSGSEETALEQRIAGLTEQVEGLEAELAAVSARADAQAEALAESAALGSRLAKTVSGIGTASEGAGTAASPEMAAAVPEPAFEAAAPDAEAETAAPDGGTAVGGTAILADGAVRAFVSRIDTEGQRARVSVNGTMQDLAVGDSMTVAADGQDCAVTLDAVGGGQAALSAACGAPEDTGEAATDSAAAPAATGDGTTVAVGETALFGDGAVRVFLARVDAEAGRARIALNGLETTTIAVGDSADAGGGCALSVSGVEANRATFGYACGA